MANIRMKDVDTARHDDDDPNLYTIVVGKHKTGSSGKVAIVTVESDVLSLLRLYKKTITDTIRLVDPTAQLFRSRACVVAGKEGIGQMYKSAWSKAGMKVPFSYTLLRKLTTVAGRESDPTMGPQIARQLSQTCPLRTDAMLFGMTGGWLQKHIAT